MAIPAGGGAAAPLGALQRERAPQGGGEPTPGCAPVSTVPSGLGPRHQASKRGLQENVVCVCSEAV